MLTLCDSIAVRILPPNKVIAGIGNELRIFQEGSRVETTLEWKLKNKVHGIDVNGSHILVHGEREFMVFRNDKEFRLLTKAKISDWISSGKLFNDYYPKICLVTSHSVALGVNICENTKESIIESRSSCVDKSTIYCSNIVGSSSRDCIVLAGTAFGELFIWKPQLIASSVKNSTHQPILHKISGHKGVIFSIDINLTFGLITTTSDDRSVRFYEILHENKLNNDSANIAKAKITPIRSVYGHNARVFKAKIISKDKTPFVISVGEDSFLCIWSIEGDLLLKRRHHFGAIIWDFDFDSTLQLLFSSGSDGNVISHKLDDCFSPIESEEVKSSSLIDEYLAKINFIDRDFLIGVTNKNKLVFRNKSDWKTVSCFGGYKCTCLVVEGYRIATAGFKMLSVFKIDSNNEIVKVFEKSVVAGVIRTVCFLSEIEMLVCDDKGECRYSNDNFNESIEIQLPRSKEPWVTSALKHDEFLILSTRQGNLLLYKCTKNNFVLNFTLKHIHGHLGVTHMHFKENHKDHFLIRTAGHDGNIKTLKVSRELSEIEIAFTESVPISWVEKIFKTSHTESFIVGFNDNHFVIWTAKQDVVFQVACGGGHRCWDLWLDEAENCLQLIFIKNKMLYTVTAKMDHNISNPYSIPYYSWHCNSCNIVETVPLNEKNVLLISGGEDNLLKFSEINEDKLHDIKSLHNISRHVSSIKSISVVKTNDTLIVFSAGGRAQICVTEMNVDTKRVEERAQYMLKSTDLDRRYERNTQEVDFDPETRFMSVSVVDLSGHYDLYLGCSDGFLRKFSYKDNTIELCAAVNYNRCILHTKIVYLNSKTYLLSAATDGCFCFWEVANFGEEQSPLFKVKHHESGINSVDVRMKDNLLLVASGGDDQVVTFSEVEVVANNFIVRVTKHFDTHTAQVNGVRLSKCLRFLYSTSIDQTICKINLGTMQLDAKVRTCIADVKGLLVFTTDNSHFCIVYGWGLQICSF